MSWYRSNNPRCLAVAVPAIAVEVSSDVSTH
ncbi:hypothetical protein [Klebsiella phage Kpn74]|uniref:Uncharacterized protein n=1 Tax=Klebsiella phage Kpn74 TaxID=3044026 RepID=A0AAT9V5D1_9CAUD|nr:hypothetical protein [Klebsiella phage Kpn74]